jgi:hypothetical protein
MMRGGWSLFSLLNRLANMLRNEAEQTSSNMPIQPGGFR